MRNIKGLKDPKLQAILNMDITMSLFCMKIYNVTYMQNPYSVYRWQQHASKQTVMCAASCMLMYYMYADYECVFVSVGENAVSRPQPFSPKD